MKKYIISCISAGLLLGQGDTREEALSQVPDYCEECSGKNKIYKDEIKFGENRAGALCDISKKQQEDAKFSPEELKEKCERLKKLYKQ